MMIKADLDAQTQAKEDVVFALRELIVLWMLRS